MRNGNIYNNRVLRYTWRLLSRRANQHAHVPKMAETRAWIGLLSQVIFLSKGSFNQRWQSGPEYHLNMVKIGFLFRCFSSGPEPGDHFRLSLRSYSGHGHADLPVVRGIRTRGFQVPASECLCNFIASQAFSESLPCAHVSQATASFPLHLLLS